MNKERQNIDTTYNVPPELVNKKISISKNLLSSPDDMIDDVIRISSIQGIEYSNNHLEKALESARELSSSCEENEAVIISSQSGDISFDFYILWNQVLVSNGFDSNSEEIFNKSKLERYIPDSINEESYSKGLFVSKINIIGDLDPVQFYGHSYDSSSESFEYPSMVTYENPEESSHPIHNTGGNRPGIEVLWFLLENSEYLKNMTHGSSGVPSLFIPGILYKDSYSSDSDFLEGQPSSNPLIQPRYISITLDIDNKTPIACLHWRDPGAGNRRSAIPDLLSKNIVSKE